MFTLDAAFLEEVGLGAMPQHEQTAFLQHVYETIENRVGTELSDGMSIAQLEEFEAIMDRDHVVIAGWLDANAPDFQADPVFDRMKQALGDEVTRQDLLGEYAATKWLALNRPDYRDVVEAIHEALKDELRQAAPELLAVYADGREPVD